MDVVAVGHRVRLLELRQEAGILERNAGDALAGQRAAHLHGRRPMGVGEHRVLETEPVERVENIGAELNAGTDLTELGRLLDHPHRQALARERICRREPADAAARHQDRQFPTVPVRHDPLRTTHRPRGYLARFAAGSNPTAASCDRGGGATSLRSSPRNAEGRAY